MTPLTATQAEEICRAMGPVPQGKTWAQHIGDSFRAFCAPSVTTEYNFTKKAKVGKWEVFIDPEASYGYFEHDNFGEGGGLWFVGLELDDYDGVFALPSDVATAIKSLGYTVEPLSDLEEVP